MYLWDIIETLVMTSPYSNNGFMTTTGVMTLGVAKKNATLDRDTADRGKKRAEFERLAVPALDMLYRQAMKYTNNPDGAQDLVQDTFERSFKAFDSFQRGTNIEAWLTTILRNTYFNQYHKAKRRPKRADSDASELSDHETYGAASRQASSLMKSAEDQYLDGFTSQEIMTALASLSPERRQVFIDAAVDGKSYKQIAQEQHIKIGTVMSRLNRARTQLREQLGDYARERGYGKSAISGKTSPNNAESRSVGAERNNDSDEAVASSTLRSHPVGKADHGTTRNSAKGA